MRLYSLRLEVVVESAKFYQFHEHGNLGKLSFEVLRDITRDLIEFSSKLALEISAIKGGAKSDVLWIDQLIDLLLQWGA